VPRLGDEDLRPTGRAVALTPCALVETPRLSTRLLGPEDVDVWLKFLMGAGSRDFLPFVEGDRASAQWWIERQMARYERDGHGLVALILKGTGEFAGQAGLLTQQTEVSEELEIGYHILPDFRGMGLATEAARAFKECIFEAGFAETVVSIIAVANTASQRVAARNGMMRDYQTGIYSVPHDVWRVRARD
jgi:[ribosomal protein S5]-alanine N-acetyltransferase